MINKPFVIVVTGRPGSGKTTLAKLLASQIHCPLLSRDSLKEGYLHTLGISHDEAVSNINWQVYELFFESVNEFLVKGFSLVIEAAFQHQLWHPKLMELASVARLALVTCSVAADVARIRMIDRSQQDSLWEYFHGQLPLTTEGDATLSEYIPPTFDCPSFTVDTCEGYHPSLDSLIQELFEIFEWKPASESGWRAQESEFDSE